MLRFLRRLLSRKEQVACARGAGSFQSLFDAPPIRLTKKAGGVVVLGNCIGEGIVAGLSSSLKATKRFNFHAVPLHIKKITDQDVQETLAGASIILVQGVVRHILPDVEKVKRTHCEVWMYPDAVLRSPWPFDGMSGARDPAVVARLGQRALAEQHIHDLALAELRKLEPNAERRLERYQALAGCGKTPSQNGCDTIHYPC